MSDPVDTDALPDRIRAKFLRPQQGCWLWTGALRNGYGATWLNGAVVYAHRLVYEATIRPIPYGMQLDHTCFNRSCVRPDHLRKVTNKQNQEHRSGPQRNNASGARGVYRDARSGRWCVQVTHHGRRHSGGMHTTLEDAALAASALRAKLYTHDTGKADAL